MHNKDRFFLYTMPKKSISLVFLHNNAAKYSFSFYKNIL